MLHEYSLKIPLRVTAHLATPIAVYDDFSPNLENLLIFLLLDRVGRANPNPTPEEVDHNQPFIEANLPLQMGTLNGEWYWQASAPWYFYEWEHRVIIHKRWDCQDQHLDWKGRRRIWSTSEGHTKGWNIILFERMAPRLDWYCVGCPNGIRSLLANCNNLTKKRRGQVIRWEVQEDEADYHLWGAGGQLMKTIPLRCLPADRPIDFRPMKWAWRPPAHMIENVDDCAMPWQNAIKLQGQQQA